MPADPSRRELLAAAVLAGLLRMPLAAASLVSRDEGSRREPTRPSREGE